MAVPAWVLIGSFLFAMIAVLVLAAAAVLLLTRGPSSPDCIPGQACGGPPPGPGTGPRGTPSPTATVPTPLPSPGSLAPPLVIGKVKANAELGYAVEYPDDWWTIEDAAARDIRLKIGWPEYGDPVLWIHGAPAGELTPAQLLAEQLSQLGQNVVGLVADIRLQNAILDPEIGYQRGIQGTYTGTADSAQGPGKPVVVFIEAATNGRLSVSAALVLVGDFTLDYSRGSLFMAFRRDADDVLNSFSWPSP